MQIKNNFQVITVGEDLIPLCEKVLKDPSHDQKYGRRMVKAIISGNLPADLAALEIGPVNHSRWLTTANRFLRMYCSKNGFSGKDERNLNLIVEVYFPMWFNIKVHHSWLEGPRLNLLTFSRKWCKIQSGHMLNPPVVIHTVNPNCRPFYVVQMKKKEDLVLANFFL